MTTTATRDAGRERLARIGLPPRGLDRLEAAAYIGVSPGTFDRLVEDGRMPRPKHLQRRHVWDRAALDRAFAALPDDRGAAGEPDTDGDGDVWSRAHV